MIAPVRLCCGERHWDKPCPDGRVWCELCYERFPQGELYVDGKGDKWDVCRDCHEKEYNAMVRLIGELRAENAGLKAELQHALGNLGLT